jgi:hypothetical protein
VCAEALPPAETVGASLSVTLPLAAPLLTALALGGAAGVVLADKHLLALPEPLGAPLTEALALPVAAGEGEPGALREGEGSAEPVRLEEGERVVAPVGSGVAEAECEPSALPVALRLSWDEGEAVGEGG